jgi:hypothetical protein
MIRTIGREEGPLWQEPRLRALTDSPDAFRPTTGVWGRNPTLIVSVCLQSVAVVLL